jgi:endo-alpha-1,4-polygalactosaminidase (GH114 family)
LTKLYPYIQIDFNEKSAINSELDIYIPSLSLAFELNGILHYNPIYGTEKLQQIQNNDNKKIKECKEKQINLVIIDTRKQNYFKEKTSKEYLKIITETINQSGGR